MPVERDPLSLGQELCEIIGDLSEGVDYASYNDYSILAYVLGKDLNKTITRLNKYDRDRLFNSGLEEGVDYEVRINELMKETKGWPMGWYEPVTPFKDLPQKYKNLIIETNRQDLFEL